MTLLEDFLLFRMSQSSRFEKVLFISADRTFQDLKQFEKVARIQIRCINIFETTTESILNNIAAELSSGPAQCAVIFSSLSDLILGVGVAQSLKFVKSLAAIGAYTTVVTIHRQLHSPTVCAQVSALMTTNALFYVNNGVMAAEVAGEIHTTRRSPTTGKVTECVEMFSLRRSADANRAASSSAQPSSVTQTPILVYMSRNKHRIFGSIDTDNSKSDGGDAALSATSAIPSSTSNIRKEKEDEDVVVSAVGPRIVEFDSTDPEFDDDDDPDADLDL